MVTLTLTRKITTIRGQRVRWLVIVTSLGAPVRATPGRRSYFQALNVNEVLASRRMSGRTLATRPDHATVLVEQATLRNGPRGLGQPANGLIANRKLRGRWS
jgi:hypothetical protein